MISDAVTSPIQCSYIKVTEEGPKRIIAPNAIPRANKKVEKAEDRISKGSN
jgi:hypothetical protein